jgi:hypothetical protein
VLNVLKTQSGVVLESTNYQPQKIIMKNNEENFKELLRAAHSVLQLVIHIKDPDGRVKRLSNIISKINKENEDN